MARVKTTWPGRTSMRRTRAVRAWPSPAQKVAAGLRQTRGCDAGSRPAPPACRCSHVDSRDACTATRLPPTPLITGWTGKTHSAISWEPNEQSLLCTVEVSSFRYSTKLFLSNWTWNDDTWAHWFGSWWSKRAGRWADLEDGDALVGGDGVVEDEAADRADGHGGEDGRPAGGEHLLGHRIAVGQAHEPGQQRRVASQDAHRDPPQVRLDGCKSIGALVNRVGSALEQERTDGSEEQRGDGGQQSQRGQVAEAGRDGRGHVVRVDVEAVRADDDEHHDDAQHEAGRRRRRHRRRADQQAVVDVEDAVGDPAHHYGHRRRQETHHDGLHLYGTKRLWMDSTADDSISRFQVDQCYVYYRENVDGKLQAASDALKRRVSFYVVRLMEVPEREPSCLWWATTGLQATACGPGWPEWRGARPASSPGCPWGRAAPALGWTAPSPSGRRANAAPRPAPGRRPPCPVRRSGMGKTPAKKAFIFRLTVNSFLVSEHILVSMARVKISKTVCVIRALSPDLAVCAHKNDLTILMFIKSLWAQTKWSNIFRPGVLWSRRSQPLPLLATCSSGFPSSLEGLDPEASWAEPRHPRPLLEGPSCSRCGGASGRDRQPSSVQGPSPTLRAERERERPSCNQGPEILPWWKGWQVQTNHSRVGMPIVKLVGKWKGVRWASVES